MAVKLISKKTLYPFLNINEDDDSYDDIIEPFCEAVTGLIEYHLGRKLEKQEFVDYFEYKDSNVHHLYLKQSPISRIDSLSFSYAKNLSRSNEVNEISKIHINYDTGLILYFPDDLKTRFKLALKVVYGAGYNLIVDSSWDYLEVPAPILIATALQTAFYFESHQRGSIGLESVSGDNLDANKQLVKTDFKFSLLPEVLALLRPFVRRGYIVGKSDVF